jgi:hypothetical protein
MTEKRGFFSEAMTVPPSPMPGARTANNPSVADYSGTKPTAALFMSVREATDDFAPGWQPSVVDKRG